MNKIPITIGITGHRNINTQYIEKIKENVKTELKNIQDKYINSEVVMLNSLASGADLLCAEAALDLSVPIVAVLPMKLEEYISDFTQYDIVKLYFVLNKAKKIIIIADKNSTRDDQYRDAGIYVTNHSNILFSLWDGVMGTESGCGTKDIMYYCIHNMKNYCIYHFMVPRENNHCELTLTKINSKFLYNEEALNRIDEFNKNSCELSVFNLSDTLSLQNQSKYISSVKSLAIIGVLMVLAFLFYDELSLSIGLPIYALLLLTGFIIQKTSRKKKFHDNYMEYRLLAETLRVQKVLNNADIEYNAASAYPVSLEESVLWIKLSVDALTVFDEKTEDNQGLWIDEQLSYHKASLDRTKKKIKKNDNISAFVTGVTVVIILAALILEYFFNNVISYEVFGITIKGIILISTGVLSASSLLLNSYYGKLALNRKLEDNTNMIRLYTNASNLLIEKGLTKENIKKIVREEIVENGNWYSYTKENTLDLNI